MAELQIGDSVRVSEDFASALPDTYTIVDIKNDEDGTCVLDNGSDFAPHHLIKVS